MSDEQAQPKRGCMRWTIRTVIGLSVIGIVLLAVGFIYQQWAIRRDIQTYPPPGKLVDVGGFDMHIHCEGEGSPTVVFEAGLGAYSLAWWTVFDDVAQETRTCAYDRIGLGWSDFVDSVSSSNDIADNLYTLLNNAGETAPYILVGHSAGGIYVRAYADRYPEDVAGIVLVDSSHENGVQRLPAEVIQPEIDTDPTLNLCSLMSPFGIRRLSGMTESMVSSFYSDEAIRGAAITRFNTNHYCAALINEIESYAAAIQQDNPPPSLDDTPLIVLTAGIGWADYPSNIPIEILEEADMIWFELQDELAALSTNSTQFVIEDSGHIIQGHRPDAIVDAIRRMLEIVDDAS